MYLIGKECWGFYVLLYEKLNLKRFFFLNVVCDLWYVFMEFKYIFIEIWEMFSFCRREGERFG